MNKQTQLILPDKILTLQPLLLFDGDCGFCNSCIKFLVKHNHSQDLNLASFQSETGKYILESPELKHISKNSLILIQDNAIYYYSTAVLNTAKHLTSPWNLAAHLIIVPECVRDAIYNFISKNRNFLFKRKRACSVQENELSKRFLP